MFDSIVNFKFAKVLFFFRQFFFWFYFFHIFLWCFLDYSFFFILKCYYHGIGSIISSLLLFLGNTRAELKPKQNKTKRIRREKMKKNYVQLLLLKLLKKGCFFRYFSLFNILYMQPVFRFLMVAFCCSCLFVFLMYKCWNRLVGWFMLRSQSFFLFVSFLLRCIPVGALLLVFFSNSVTCI